MILIVSGRTDIVAFYSKWFINRYREGFVDVRNPFNPKLVSRINFADVDAILFCTKNPEPILKYLPEIKKPILFHVTLTPYKEDIEPFLPPKSDIIKSIKELSKLIGPDYLTIRYDPVFLSPKYSLSYHKKAFEKMCSLLEGYTSKIIISFLDDYKNVRKNYSYLKYRPFTENDYATIGKSFSASALNHQMTVQTCFEEQDLISYGFIKGECLSHELAYTLTGKKYPDWKARSSGKCHCVKMVDIGAYNTCHHLCRYCYANYDESQIVTNIKNHDDTSSLLIGHLTPDDTIKIRTK